MIGRMELYILINQEKIFDTNIQMQFLQKIDILESRACIRELTSNIGLIFISPSTREESLFHYFCQKEKVKSKLILDALHNRASRLDEAIKEQASSLISNSTEKRDATNSAHLDCEYEVL